MQWDFETARLGVAAEALGRVLLPWGIANSRGAWAVTIGALHVFDEVALSNDIAAACAGAGTVAAAPPAASQSPEERLERLEGLRKKGLVSEEEYQRKRTAILEEL